MNQIMSQGSEEFRTTKEELAEIVEKLQTRRFAEEVDFIESKGGDEYILKGIQANAAEGIRTTDVERRKSFFGSNQNGQNEMKSYLSLWRIALEDVPLQVLLALCIVGIIGEYFTSDNTLKSSAEYIGLILTILLLSFLTGVRNGDSEKEFIKIRSSGEIKKQYKVIRDGSLQKVSADDLVVGDVMKLDEEIEIPVDGYVIEAHELTVDDPSIAGESKRVSKATLADCISKRNTLKSQGIIKDVTAVPSPVLVSGSKVVSGDGLLVVIAVGSNSSLGKISAILDEYEDSTQLQEKVEQIAVKYGKISILATFLTLLLLIFHFVVDLFAGGKLNPRVLPNIIRCFISTASLLVTIIPDSLSITVVMSIAFCARNLAKHNILVRKKKACEKLAETNNILIEKTGVLSTQQGTKNTLRPGSKVMIRLLKDAGIRVRIVTNEAKSSGILTAIESGISNDPNSLSAIGGSELQQLSGGLICKKYKIEKCSCPSDPYEAVVRKRPIRVDTVKDKESFEQIADKLDVLYESRPEQTDILISGLKERGDVVTVLGSQSLKKADLGIVLNDTASEVAVSSAGIIILDNNLSSVMKAVLWSRNIIESVKRVVQFQSTVILVVSICSVTSAGFIKQPIFRPIHMLWINALSDTIASYFLVNKHPREIGILQSKPQSQNAEIISDKMNLNIYGQTFYQVIVILFLIIKGELLCPEFGKELANDNEPSHRLTFVFAAFVMMTLANLINSLEIGDRKQILSDLTSNPILLPILVGIICIQFAIVEFGGRLFGCHPNGLTIRQWVICFTLGAIGLRLSLILKLIPEPVSYTHLTLPTIYSV
eukprot:TRINITY_DN3255_c0_g2_i1.p1 TRINITY_DN3255_c0_g2~~TRINITY_DN3255_c0_g2_i1.p1  ORF type:complete len:826 (-),score=136.99 TRINITY_DN3255_c0_g2_i1:35-2512(-)